MNIMNQENAKSYVEKWLSGINSEVAFWDDWFATQGSQWQDVFNYRTQSIPKVRDESQIKNINIPTVLDIGAGPISNFGIITERGKINLHACDPLANIYLKMLIKWNITPYCFTEFAFAERLTDKYPKNYFDHVVIENALDHTFDPIAVLIESLNVVKNNSTIRIIVFENEAEYGDYNGFHQWNIKEENGNLIIWKENFQVNIGVLLNEYCTINVSANKLDDRRIIDSIITKNYSQEIPHITNRFIFDMTMFNWMSERIISINV